MEPDEDEPSSPTADAPFDLDAWINAIPVDADPTPNPFVPAGWVSEIGTSALVSKGFKDIALSASTTSTQRAASMGTDMINEALNDFKTPTSLAQSLMKVNVAAGYEMMKAAMQPLSGEKMLATMGVKLISESINQLVDGMLEQDARNRRHFSTAMNILSGHKIWAETAEKYAPDPLIDEEVETQAREAVAELEALLALPKLDTEADAMRLGAACAPYDKAATYSLVMSLLAFLLYLHAAHPSLVSELLEDVAIYQIVNGVRQKLLPNEDD